MVLLASRACFFSLQSRAPLYGHITGGLLIHQSIGVCMVCNFERCVSKTSMNTHLQGQGKNNIFISFEGVPRSEIAEMYSKCTFEFVKSWESSPMLFHHYAFPPALYKNSRGLQNLTST